MKKFLALFLLFILSLLNAEESRFMKYPDIRKEKIVFTYENDLWLINSSGGTATRITNAPGNETMPKFSPDGKWIAFTGSYDGGSNVYIIPSEGGEPKRLTYNPDGGQTIGWTPDGEKIVFRSRWENFIGRDPNLYFVDKDGSAPERFPLDRGTICSFSKDGKKILYTRRGDEEYYWKRYKGGQYSDIWMYDFVKNEFTPISDYVGKNTYPMWIENKLYFISDRTNGIANLYVQDLDSKKVTQLTTYDDFDIMYPSTDGINIVFIRGGYLNVYNVKTNKTEKLSVTAPSDKWALRDRNINPKDYIHYFNISNDGESVILEARGDVFNLQVEDGMTKNLSITSGTKEMYPQISPDGKWVAFFSDKTGEYQLYIQKADGGEWIQLTNSLDKTEYKLLWSPDGKKILFGNKDLAIFYIDVDTKKITKIDESHQLKNDEFYWEMADYSWSPDSKWICYSFVQYNRNNQIFLYNLDDKKKTAVTSDFYDNLNPSFDANGKYLYYLSSRNFDIQMDFYEDNHVVEKPYEVMAVQLQDGQAPPFSDDAADQKKSDEAFRIDIEGIQKRTFTVPVEPGNYFYLTAGKGKILWCSVPKFTEEEYEEIFKPGKSTKWDLHIFDMKDKKETVISENIRSYDLSANRENLIIQKEGNIFTSSVDAAFKSKGLGSKLNLNEMSYTVKPQEEWTQIFNDTWRWYRDFFYDMGFHGRDWQAMGDKYRAFIPYLTSREDLNWTMSQMVGELCVSHTYVGGGDLGTSPKQENTIYTGWLGADLVPDAKTGLYKFAKIYGPTEYDADITSPLVRPDIKLNEGDYLIAINGTDVKVPQDYFKLLQVAKGQKVSVTVNSRASKEGASTYEVELIRNSLKIRYSNWLANNINTVLKKSDGKVGYMHINAMGAGGIGEFDKFWRAFKYKDGIIIDVRRNGGGWTEYFLIDKLERQLVGFNVLRGMEPFRYPGSAGNGRYVVISNENNGSDGECFIQHFKARNLGTVVGVPSWGGLVGIINAQTTIDNGSINQSNNAFYGKEGKWWVENHGADPDVLVENDPASVMSGKDNQLDKAIEVTLEKIKNTPLNFPGVPEYPKK